MKKIQRRAIHRRKVKNFGKFSKNLAYENPDSMPVLPKKRLGQNFLIDFRIKDRIIEACQLNANETVLEIGPGLGVISFDLVQRAKNVFAIEKDYVLYDELKRVAKDRNTTNLHLIHADFLKYDIRQLPPFTKIIGNLPYYISTPIIEKLLLHHNEGQKLYLTLQLEFAQRLVAKHNSKTYGSLSCFVQYYADVKILFKIHNRAFRPVPKVTSCFVEITLRKPKNKAHNESFLFQIIQKSFQSRRKKIINALAFLEDQERLVAILRELKIEEKKRPENLSLENYIDICNAL